jgi:hypothetical protein
VVTDRVFHDDNMLRYSLLIVCTSAYLLSALMWWLGLKPYRRTVDQAEAERYSEKLLTEAASLSRITAA